jgi:hypothetical protein
MSNTILATLHNNEIEIDKMDFSNRNNKTMICFAPDLIWSISCCGDEVASLYASANEIEIVLQKSITPPSYQGKFESLNRMPRQIHEELFFA